MGVGVLAGLAVLALFLAVCIRRRGGRGSGEAAANSRRYRRVQALPGAFVNVIMPGHPRRPARVLNVSLGGVAVAWGGAEVAAGTAAWLDVEGGAAVRAAVVAKSRSVLRLRFDAAANPQAILALQAACLRGKPVQPAA